MGFGRACACLGFLCFLFVVVFLVVRIIDCLSITIFWLEALCNWCKALFILKKLGEKSLNRSLVTMHNKTGLTKLNQMTMISRSLVFGDLGEIPIIVHQIFNIYFIECVLLNPCCSLYCCGVRAVRVCVYYLLEFQLQNRLRLCMELNAITTLLNKNIIFNKNKNWNCRKNFNSANTCNYLNWHLTSTSVKWGSPLISKAFPKNVGVSAQIT